MTSILFLVQQYSSYSLIVCILVHQSYVGCSHWAQFEFPEKKIGKNLLIIIVTLVPVHGYE